MTQLHHAPRLAVVRQSGARRKAPPAKPDRRPARPRREDRIPAAARTRLDPTAYKVLVVCDRLRRGEQAAITITDQEIGARCHKSTAVVQRALKAIEEAGYIRRVRRRGVRRICFAYSPAGREARPPKVPTAMSALIFDQPPTPNFQPPGRRTR